MALAAAPDGDVSIGTWVGFRGACGSITSTVSIYLYINELVLASDDRVVSPNGPVSTDCIFTLGNNPDPQSSLNHRLEWAYGMSVATGAKIAISAAVLQGVTTIATMTVTASNGPSITANLQLTAAQADSITDYNDLRVQFIANQISGGARRANIYWTRFITPTLFLQSVAASPPGLGVAKLQRNVSTTKSAAGTGAAKSQRQVNALRSVAAIGTPKLGKIVSTTKTVVAAGLAIKQLTVSTTKKAIGVGIADATMSQSTVSVGITKRSRLAGMVLNPGFLLTRK